MTYIQTDVYSFTLYSQEYLASAVFDRVMITFYHMSRYTTREVGLNIRYFVKI